MTTVNRYDTNYMAGYDKGAQTSFVVQLDDYGYPVSIWQGK